MGLTFELATSHVPCCLLLSHLSTSEEQPQRTRQQTLGSGCSKTGPEHSSSRGRCFPYKELLQAQLCLLFLPQRSLPIQRLCLTWTCSRQQLQAEKSSLVFPTTPQSQRSPRAACMSPTAPQADTGRAPGSPSEQAVPCTEQLAVPCFLPS